jgi:hypothetical protein
MKTYQIIEITDFQGTRYAIKVQHKFLWWKYFVYIMNYKDICSWVKTFESIEDTEKAVIGLNLNQKIRTVKTIFVDKNNISSI